MTKELAERSDRRLAKGDEVGVAQAVRDRNPNAGFMQLLYFMGYRFRTLADAIKPNQPNLGGNLMGKKSDEIRIGHRSKWMILHSAFAQK